MRAEDLPLRQRLLLRTYRWRRIEPVPRSTLARPLPEARVGLVTTAGLVPPGARPFDLGMRGGDPSFRVIPRGTPPGALAVHHRSDAFDRTALAQDLAVVFPLEVLERFAAEGRIGTVAPRQLSFMGSITAPLRLMREEGPRAAELFRADKVDLALLVPV